MNVGTDQISYARLAYSTPVDEQLDAGEAPLWIGRPRQGIFLRGSDAAMIPFSLLWCSFAIFWEYGAIHSKAPMMMRIWGIPFVVIGLHFVAGRFFVDAWQRRRTWYAVTSQRVLIVRGGFQGSQTCISLPLHNLPALTMQTHVNGLGSIVFGASVVETMSSFRLSRNKNQNNQPPPPAFEQIADVREVYDLIRHAQEGLRAVA